ncbi:MAG: 3'(2'),5'-bisphosphate nucleotidase CysQ [Paracoccaceae bacterium]
MPAAERQDDLTLLRDAAREAGKIARRYWRRSPENWDKAGGAGPVSEADLAVNRMLARELGASRPGYGWLSEESDDSSDRLAARRVFVIDPIDGTRAFLAGEETFAHSLAVVEDGRPVAGVVYLPVPDLMFCACEGGAATLNGEVLRATEARELAGADILTTRASLDPLLWPGGVPDIRRSFRASLAYRMCLVAQGRFDGMVTLRDAWEWDIAAGALIAAMAGAAVSDRHGDALRFNAARPQAPGVLTAPPALHAAFLSRLRPVG